MTARWRSGLTHRPFKAASTGSNPVRVTNGGLAQLGEHLPYKQRVGGSIPSTSTILNSELWCSGLTCPPVTRETAGSNPVSSATFIHGSVAQLVEQRTENLVSAVRFRPESTIFPIYLIAEVAQG